MHDTKLVLCQGTSIVADSLLQKSFLKSFENGVFSGTVVSYKRPYFQIVYEDDDKEEMSGKEVLQQLSAPSLLRIRFVRRFPDVGLQEGTVESYNDAQYMVRYNNGTREIVPREELIAQLLTTEKCPRKRKHVEVEPPFFQRAGTVLGSSMGGVRIERIVLATAATVEKRNFFNELFCPGRLLVVEQRVGNAANTPRPSIRFTQFGCTYELASVKMVEDSKNFRGGVINRLDFIYVATIGPNLPPVNLQQTFEKIADFASLKSSGKVASRLELMQSSAIAACPPHMCRMSDIELVEEPVSEETKDYMGEGCGFIGNDMLDKLVDASCMAVQVRIFGPLIGVYKGMLVRKQHITGVQLTNSMQKVPHSIAATNSEDWVSIVVISECPSGPCKELGRVLTTNQPCASFKPKELSTMVCRLLITLGVPVAVLNKHKNARVPMHSWVVGLADPTATIPEGFVFLTGFNTFHSHYDISPIDRLFVTRSPCVKAEHGRMLRLLTSQPRDMPTADWLWLLTLPFGGLLFSTAGSAAPLALTCADGDLDGDRYFVCWNKSILQHIKHRVLAALPVKQIGDADVVKRNPNWFCEAQEHFVEHAMQNYYLISRLHTHMNKIQRNSEMGMDDPDAILLADAYTHTLMKRHEKITLNLPPRLLKLIGVSKVV